MKKILAILFCSLFLGACANVSAPVNGLVWTNVKAPLAATNDDTKPTLVGRAEATSILGIIATGDASIEAAARNGGITHIHHVDYESHNFFGVVATFTTVVYGN
jgi:hypothetical protein